MDVYRTEEEQVAAIQRWWNENYKLIIAAVVLAIASFGGWKWYQYVQMQNASAAAGLYEGMMKSAQEIVAGGKGAADAVERMQRAGDSLLKEHGDTAYAQYGALMLAGNAVEIDDYANAEKYLRSALAIGGSEGTKIVIQNRLARVLSALGKHDEAVAILAADAPESMLSSRSETRGDVLLAQGKRSEARAEYLKAMAALPEEEKSSGLLSMKLDYVAE